MVLQKPISFKTFLSLTSTNFEYLLNIVGHRIAKQDTNYRKAIPPVDRLSITLKYLSSGNSFSSICDVFKVSPQLISSIITEVCHALVGELSDYVKIPRTPEEWRKVADYNEYDSENKQGEVIPGEWRRHPHENCLVNMPREDNDTTSDAIVTAEETRMELTSYFLSDVLRLEWQFN
ncbi:unnamed protein product [Parnassius apollo]|uniref:(apollo) hypothetical protein n=1 Tax=Parnassius apollo TaxID=110799 RepID=A0A8S3XZA9_PARAO|nr:unnamed protein product [Parnassius apollo]